MKDLMFSDFSEERLAAYLDGSLSPDEMIAFKSLLSSNPILNEIVNEISNVPLETGETAFDDYPGFMPEETLEQLIPFVEESIIESDDFLQELSQIEIPHPHFDGINSPEYEAIHDDMVVGANSTDNSNQILNTMANTDTYRTFGETGENLLDPIFIKQPDDHSCALRSQQIVLRDFGIDIPFEDLEHVALEAGVYTDDGTYRCDIGKVLEIAGVGMHQVQGSTIYDLTNELAQGHRVIVSVDADELWYNDSIINKTTNWLNDVFGEQGGNHALIVAGIEVNPDNPNDVKVVLTDPGTGHLRIEYPLDQFMDAWQDSDCFMAATDDPAPFQYDARTGMEVPSNFAAQQFYNQFILSNSYQLNPDMINIPADYLPAYNGHLDMLGDVQYEDFQEKYEVLQGAREEVHHSHSIVGNTVESLIGDIKDLFSHHETTPYDGHGEHGNHYGIGGHGDDGGIGGHGDDGGIGGHGDDGGIGGHGDDGGFNGSDENGGFDFQGEESSL